MAKRAGRTAKLSISIDERDLVFLKKRADEACGGNMSAAIVEMIHLARELEGRKALAEWLSAVHGQPTAEAMDAIRAEWRGPTRRRRRTKAA